MPKEVVMQRRDMAATATPAAIPIFKKGSSSRWPKTFWRITLLVRKRVRLTEITRKMLAHAFWGEADMNWGSLRQRRRQMEKKGSRQPLKT